MDWIKITVYTSRQGIEPVLALLLSFGIESTQISDESEFSEFLQENRKIWDYVDDDLLSTMSKETHIDFYIKPDETDTLNEIKKALSDLKSKDAENVYGRLCLTVESLTGEDWQNSWKKYFHTFTISDRLIIKPYWEEIEPTDKKIFEINPGLSFGTGTHHTTKMCLEDIIYIIKEGDSVLDLGAGSGILAIVSLIFGAKDAVCVDIDENSLKTITENLDRNKIKKDICDVYIGNILEDNSLQARILEKNYDVVLVNIVADVVLAVLPFVKKVIRKNGIFIASGIIEDRISEVKNKIIDCGFTVISEKRSADWAEFVCQL